MHMLFKTHKADLLPFFEELLPDFRKLIDPSRPGSDRQWSLCIFDDLMEFAGPMSVKYRELFVKHLVSYILDPNPEVRQAAAYGCGVMAQFGGPDYANDCKDALPLLIKVISAPDSREKDNVNPTENCISAVTKIIRYNCIHYKSLPESIMTEVLPTWLTWLPITEDHEEAPHVFGFLCDLMQSNHPAIIGENQQNLPGIVKIIAEAFACEVFENYPEMTTRLKSILSQIQTGVPQMWSAGIAGLDERQRKALQG